MANHKKNYPFNIANGYSAAATASSLEKTQIGKFHTKGGHGFAAEEASALSYKLHGQDAKIIGGTNQANGADLLANGVQLQLKYCQSPQATINAAFAPDSGNYRYGDQVLEVPADQYESCIELMRQKISGGKVPGVTSPDEAERLVRKGHITYKQARNIARAGNIDSLAYDAKTQAVTATGALSISFLICFIRAKQDGLSNKDAAYAAMDGSWNASITSFVAGTATAQMLRTRAAAVGAVASRRFVRWGARSRPVHAFVTNLAHGSLGKVVHGGAATNHVAKLLRTNVITFAATTVISTTPDFCRAAVARSISWSQFSKNLAITASGTITGMGGWMTGTAAGAALGGPAGALVGGLLGAFGGGTAGRVGARQMLDRWIEDDAKKMLAITQDVVSELAYEYLLSQQEIKTLGDELQPLFTAKWLKRMFEAGNQNGNDPLEPRQYFARKAIEPICQTICSKRPRLVALDPGPLGGQIKIVMHGNGVATIAAM
ncbi:hypothetical protein [Nitrococcus mobilis]|nr:hypothetical protein [Nitrococcus mobilis]